MRRIERFAKTVVSTAAVAFGIVLSSPVSAQPPGVPGAPQPPAPPLAVPGGVPPADSDLAWQGWAGGGMWPGAGQAWQGRPMVNPWRQPMAGWQGQPGAGFGRGRMPGAWQQRPLGPAARQLMRRGVAARRFQPQRRAFGGMMARPQGLQQQLFRGLRLDEAQRARVRDINQKHQPELQALNRTLADARRAMNQARTADTIDEAAIRKGASAVAAAEADIAIARGRLRTDLLSVRTPEQQKTVAAHRQLAQDRQRRLQERRQPPQKAPAPQKKD